MVMLADPIFGALEASSAEGKRILYMSPRGKVLDHDKIRELSEEEELVILCGHYEGIDQRAIDLLEYGRSFHRRLYTYGRRSFLLMVLIDAVARFIPDVLGNSLSTSDESVYSGLLECDQYTKPRTYQNMEVPEVLTGGNHKLIHLWQYENALNLTKQRRPDLWKKYLEAEKNLTKDEKILEKVAAKPR